jgi:endonuclease/exonuclease/phosphatase family metal-dependent hydrolase
MNGAFRGARARARHPRRAVALLTGLVLASGSLLAGNTSATAATPSQRTAQMSATFRVSTFNILGASHTGPRSRFDDYKPRMRRTLRVLDTYDFSVVGLQEFQKPQYDMFMSRTAGAWGVYPGLEEGRRPVQNSIIWRKSEWQRVEAHTYKIPYFYGKLVDEPYVKLRNKASGATVWVIDTHNPADSHGDASAYRQRALVNQAALVNTLDDTGVPVLLVGDFNDRDKPFCYLTSQAPLEAANGGSNDGKCVLPTPRFIDWIFQSPSVQVSGWSWLEKQVATITDHKVPYADVAVPLS